MHFRQLGGRTQRELYYELESVGGFLGACTYKEFIHFYVTATPRYFSNLVKIAAALLGGLEADAADCVAEKRLVLSEIREDNQKNDIDFLSDKYVWAETSLQNPVLGTISSVKAFTLPMLQEEKERTFTKQNVFFYVTGCFDTADLARLSETVGLYNLGDRPDTVNQNMAPVPAGFRQRDGRVKISHRQFAMHDVQLSFDIDFAKLSRPDLLYLDCILAEGLCSLIRAEMIEKKGLVYDLSSSIEQYRNIGVYHLDFTIYKSKLYEGVRSLISVLKRVKKDIAARDLETARVFKTDNQMKLLDDPEALNWAFAYENHILDQRYADIAAVADVYRQITAERLVKTANEIFRTDNLVVVSLGNKKGLSEIGLREIVSEL